MQQTTNYIVMKKRHIIVAIIAIIILAGLGACAHLYKVYVKDPIATADTTIKVYITPGLSSDSLHNILAQQIDTDKARKIVEFMYNDDYDYNARKGYYELKGTTSIYRAARKLAAGSQTPITFTFNNLRLIDQLVERIDETLYMSADSIEALLKDDALCAQYGFDTTTIIAMFLPDTYEFYWTVSPQRFMERMHQYYEQFWNDERKQKAQRIGLTPIEVSTLASIVEEETIKSDEMPIVAGLYLNRLRRNIPLQADPTVKYAVGDFSLQRILNKHLATPSPYNTYLNTGLPPSPIRIPSKTAIDAVLNYRQHNYLYMCAKEDFSGYHNFATTLSQHNRNAERYHNALNRRGIK